MNDCFSDIGRYISILDRLMKMYYDRGLSDFEIGWGQQFYVEYIYDHPGSSQQEMVKCIRVDKATLTKSIKKLTEIGYVCEINDDKDRRVKHLYLTEKAIPAAKQIKKIHQDFGNAICDGIDIEQMQLAEEILCQMANNLNQKVWHRMEEHNGKQKSDSVNG